MSVHFHVLSEVDVPALKLSLLPFHSSRTTLLQIAPFCEGCVCGVPNYNNPSQQCRVVSGFGVHALFITAYYRSAVAEAVMLSL